MAEKKPIIRLNIAKVREAGYELMKNEEEWKKYLANVRKCPNEDDMNKARDFARAMLKRLEAAPPITPGLSS